MIQETQRTALLRQLAASPSGAVFTCNSGSMEPTIAVGQRVRVHRCSRSELRVGDVVVYEGDGCFMLHRIVLLSPSRSWFLHIGDAPSDLSPRRAATAAIIGIVDLPRKRPHPRTLWRAARYALRIYLYW